MAIKFQYNKTSLGELGKQLKMRQKALPTIKSKESALRSEVKKAKDTAQDFRRQLDALTAQYDYMVSLWFADGVDILKRLARLGIEFEVFNRKMELLDFARRKTTQKVNLYEKVQIPGYEDAIRKIKRFMEDEENLSKSAQKIVKTKQQQAGEGAML